MTGALWDRHSLRDHSLICRCAPRTNQNGKRLSWRSIRIFLRVDLLPQLMQTEPQLQKALTHSPALPQATVPTHDEMCLIVSSLIWPELLVGLVEASWSMLSLYSVLCLCPHKHKLGQAQSTPESCRNSLRICLWPTYCKN